MNGGQWGIAQFKSIAERVWPPRVDSKMGYGNEGDLRIKLRCSGACQSSHVSIGARYEGDEFHCSYGSIVLINCEVKAR